jgi:hypothetical protein
MDDLSKYFDSKVLKVLKRKPNFGLLAFFDFHTDDVADTLITLAFKVNEKDLEKAKVKLAEIITKLVIAGEINGSASALHVLPLDPVSLLEKNYIVSSMVYTDYPDTIKAKHPDLISTASKVFRNYAELYPE